MNSFEPYLFALHSYRNFYQVGEFFSAQRPINGIDTIGFLSQAGKVCTDFFVSMMIVPIPGKEQKPLSSFGLVEGGFRCFQIGHSVYLLYKNPPGLDRKSHQLQILMEILNIGRIALQILRPAFVILPYIQLALCGADALLKAPMIRQKCDSQAMRAVIQGISINLLFFSGCSILLSSSHAARQAMGILSFSAFAIHTLAQIVFEEMNILPSPRRDLFQWTCVALGSSAITMVAMIKLGISTALVSSIGGIAQALIFAAGTVMIVESVRRAYRVLTGGPIMNWSDLIDFNQYVGLSMILRGVMQVLNPI